MKKTIKYIAFGFAGIMALSACSEDFMKEKKNYDNVNEGIWVMQISAPSLRKSILDLVSLWIHKSS